MKVNEIVAEDWLLPSSARGASGTGVLKSGGTLTVTSSLSVTLYEAYESARAAFYSSAAAEPYVPHTCGKASAFFASGDDDEYDEDDDFDDEDEDFEDDDDEFDDDDEDFEDEDDEDDDFDDDDDDYDEDEDFDDDNEDDGEEYDEDE